MIRRKTEVIILALILCLCGSGYAGALGISEAISFLENEQAVSFEINAEFGKLPQYSENRTAQLNRILRHLTFTGFTDSHETSLTVSVDGTELFSVSQKEAGGISRKILSTDPDHVYSIPAGETDETESDLPLLNSLAAMSDQKNIYFSLISYISFFERLPDYFPDRSGSAKILQKYKDYGTAVQKVSIRLSAEELTEYAREFSGNYPENREGTDFQKLVFSGRQDVELLVTEAGKALKIRYGGKAGFSEEDMRIVRLEWKTVRSDTVEKDELILRTPDEKSTRRNNLLLEYIWRKPEDGKETFFWKTETDDLEDGVRIRGIVQCTAETDSGQISGDFCKTVTVKGKSTEDDILYAFSEDPADHYTGTLEIISKKDKIETGRLKTSLKISSDKRVFTETASAEPSRISDVTYRDIQKELFSKILRELLKLPQEDLAFLTEGIPAESMNMLLPDYESIKESSQ